MCTVVQFVLLIARHIDNWCQLAVLQAILTTKNVVHLCVVQATISKLKRTYIANKQY